MSADLPDAIRAFTRAVLHDMPRKLLRWWPVWLALFIAGAYGL